MNKLQKIVQKLRKKRREGAKTNYSKDLCDEYGKHEDKKTRELESGDGNE